MQRQLRFGLFGSRSLDQFGDSDKMFTGRAVHMLPYEVIENVNKEYREISLKQDTSDQQAWAKAAEKYTG